MYLTDLADACRTSGLKVVELPGWKTRSRPASTGGFDPEGVLCHHTGSSGDGRKVADSMALVGRPDLPPPLCQLALDRDGTVYVCAAGRANHAGKAKAHGGLPAGDGNELYIGIEAMHAGPGEPWSALQYAAYVRLVAALCEHYGFDVEDVAGHKETSVTGKIDPTFDMDRFRADVRQALPASPFDFIGFNMHEARGVEGVRGLVRRWREKGRKKRGGKLRRAPKAIALNEARKAHKALRGLKRHAFVTGGQDGAASRELGFLLRRDLRLVDLHYTHAADGEGLVGPKRWKRGILDALVDDADQRYALITTHFGFTRRQVRVHLRRLAEVLDRLEAEGCPIFLYADANAAVDELVALLKARGFDVHRDGVDVVAASVPIKGGVIDKRWTESDHNSPTART